jgi:DNA-binding NarL/FixJ family response regulator
VIRVLVVDDHPILNAGVQALVHSQDDLELAGSAPDGETGILLARSQCPDVIVMDVSMPGMGGIAATRVIILEHPSMRVLMLTWHANQETVRSALDAGATGYLLKDANHQVLLEAIRAVTHGETRISPLVQSTVPL